MGGGGPDTLEPPSIPAFTWEAMIGLGRLHQAIENNDYVDVVDDDNDDDNNIINNNKTR